MSGSNEDMQFGSEGDANSVDSFEQQLKQQEIELQNQLRQQEEEMLAQKAAEAGIPKPVSAPSWQSSDGMDMSNGNVEQTEESFSSGGVKRPSDSQENGDEVTDEKDDTKQPAFKQRKLDEFTKLWNAVQESPKDFQAWTGLLTHVDQQSDLECGRQAYTAFFARYPYCYGYWKKFADLEKRKGTKESTLKVFEEGVTAIPLSVDLWVHYLDYITHTYVEAAEEEYVRQQFDRAVEACGLEFRSDKMWDAYINWENTNKRWQRVTAVYDRLFPVPVAKYAQHWNKFQEHVRKHTATDVVTAEEFLAHRRSLKAAAASSGGELEEEEGAEAPPGVEDDGAPGGEAAVPPPTIENEEENKSVQQLIITQREKVFQATSEEVKLRWSYEEAIKRPYFHVKPLERSQLQAWRDYLEYQVKQGNLARTRVLFERCLIAAALYEEFWMRYINFLGSRDDIPADELRSVYYRACTIHLHDKLKPHLSWAYFEEEKGYPDTALEILAEVMKRFPDALEPHLQEAALERRRGNLDRAEELLKLGVENFKEKMLTGIDKVVISVGYGNMLIKYARFLALFRGAAAQAAALLDTVVQECLSASSGARLSDSEQHTLEACLWVIIELALSCSPPDLALAGATLKLGTGAQFSPRARVVFGSRYHQFVLDCGHADISVSESARQLRELQQEAKELEGVQEDGVDKSTEYSTSPDKRSKSSSKSSAAAADKSFTSYPPPSSGSQQQNGSYGQPPVGGYSQYPPQAPVTGAPQHPPPQHPPPPQGQQGQYGSGGYGQNYQQQAGYPPQQYQGWGYTQPQGNYGYNQQNWSGYTNYYGQR